LSRAQRRTTTGARSLIPELLALLERRQAITRRCERAQARIIAHVFHRSGRPLTRIDSALLEDRVQGGRGPLAPAARPAALGRNLERADVSRSVAMKLTGHKTEHVYRRYAIMAESDLREARVKLAATLGSASGSFSDNSGDSAKRLIARCLKKSWAGTGLNRRHQDFQIFAIREAMWADSPRSSQIDRLRVPRV